MRKYLVLLVVLSLVFSIFSLKSVSFAQKKYRESPMLAELVKAGKLPPVEERLPKNPFVVGPGVLIPEKDLKWEVGEYGGTLRMFFIGTSGGGDYIILLCEPLLCAPGISDSGIRGNIIEDFKVTNNNRVFTFKIREGLKWSDGHPVTTEDVRFAYEDVLLNDKLTPLFPIQFRSGGSPTGEPMKLEILDKYTFRISFKDRYGSFLRVLAIEGWAGHGDLLKPAHYLKQFHPKYTPMEKLEPLIKKGGFGPGEWWRLFTAKDFSSHWVQERPDAVGFPVLAPWMLSPSTTSDLLVFERNPYYFKVDVAGNQLPYIDKIVGYRVQDQETALLKILAGEIDFSGQSNITQLPLLKANEQKGGYKVYLLDKHTDGAPVLLNLTYEDPVWRKVVGDVRFRKALTLGINRKEIIDTIYYGLAEPTSAIPSEYNPVEANKLLDQMGLKKRSPEGWRLGPDGKPFTINFETIGIWEPDMIPVNELVVEYWKKLGINVRMKQIDPTLWRQRRDANQLQASVLWGAHDKGTQLGLEYTKRLAALPWYQWYSTGGKQGEEPPEWYKTLLKLGEAKMKSLPGSSEWKDIEKKTNDLEYKYVPAIYITERVKVPLIASAKLGNVPTSGYAIAANFAVEQFFFRK
jgi:peptide/nickel transport system substrate-binding protein